MLSKLNTIANKYMEIREWLWTRMEMIQVDNKDISPVTFFFTWCNDLDVEKCPKLKLAKLLTFMQWEHADSIE